MISTRLPNHEHGQSNNQRLFRNALERARWCGFAEHRSAAEPHQLAVLVALTRQTFSPARQ